MSASETAAGGRTRLARRVVELYPELSFMRAKRAVEGGQVSVDGVQIADSGAWVTAAQDVSWNRNRPLARAATGPSVELVHLDDAVAVAVKPAGLLTLPTTAREKDTLLARVSTAVARRRESGSARTFVAVVHRLDKETSGLVVFALNRKAVESLSVQLESHSMERVYEAILEGEIERDSGKFDRALVGDGTRRRRWVAKPGERGKPAVTHWRVTRRFAGATLVQVRLETGRTHQIRIHFAAAGFPVLGERVYRPIRMEPAEITAPRQMLHAGELAFTHPTTGKKMRFSSPPPPDFAGALELLAAPPRRRGKS